MTRSPSASRLDPDHLRRREFPALGDVVYLNAASVAPLPERARRAIGEHIGRRAEVAQLGPADFSEPLERCRRAAARLIGAEPEEIALGGNTTFGINLAAATLPVEPGRSIVISDREFPANVYPWMRRAREGVPLEIVPATASGHPDEDRIAARVASGKVGILSVSSVQFVDGFRMDLDRLSALCRENGTFLVVDAIQSLGHLPIDVQETPIDILATGGHKWLCGPFGTGFVYVRRDLQQRLEPCTVGWTAMTASDDISSLLDYRYDLHDDARKFEGGTPPFQDLAGLASSLEMIAEIGPERISRHAVELADELVGILEGVPGRVTSDRSPTRRSAIVGFVPREPEPVSERLETAGIEAVVREGVLRFSPHLYNTIEDIERVREALS